MRRLDDADDVDAELLHQVAVAVVHGDDAIHLGVDQLRRRLALDGAQPLRVVGGVRLNWSASAGRNADSALAIA